VQKEDEDGDEVGKREGPCPSLGLVYPAKEARTGHEVVSRILDRLAVIEVAEVVEAVAAIGTEHRASRRQLHHHPRPTPRQHNHHPSLAEPASLGIA
jgi:hypothetical protein